MQLSVMLETLAIGIPIFIILYRLFPMIQVCGGSMYPTYLDGEIIYGTRLYRKSKLKKGDVVVYKSPTDESRVVIKRVDHIMVDKDKLYVYCLGDNAEFSYDSRAYGYVSSTSLLCKIIKPRRNYHDVCN